MRRPRGPAASGRAGPCDQGGADEARAARQETAPRLPAGRAGRLIARQPLSLGFSLGSPVSSQVRCWLWAVWRRASLRLRAGLADAADGRWAAVLRAWGRPG